MEEKDKKAEPHQENEITRLIKDHERRGLTLKKTIFLDEVKKDA